jgi:Icc-related predicted phosphoesterase
MKIQFVSDLHLDLNNQYYGLEYQHGYKGDTDVLILAGDIAQGIHPFVFEAIETVPHVLYVPGNHEYYTSSIEKVDFEFKGLDAKYSNFHYMNPKSVKINGWHFAGVAFWTDFCNELWYMQNAEKYMNDYRYITYKGTPLMPSDTKAFHEEAVEWLQSLEDVDVVITHHAPSFRSISGKHIKDPMKINPAYASDTDWLVKKLSPYLWVHGHTHGSVEYLIGNTVVGSNCLGYGDENPQFDPGLQLNLIEYPELAEEAIL